MDNFHLMEQIKLFATVNKIDFNLILYFDTNRSIMPESGNNHRAWKICQKG